MKGQPRKRCPVCWQSITPTRGRSVQRHWDSVGRDICPMSGEAYELAQIGVRRVTIEYQESA